MSENPSSEVEIVREEPLSVSEITEPTTGALQRLEAEALAMDKAFKIAKGLSATEMVPEHFQQSYTGTQRNPHPPLGESAIYNLAAAILYGAELGLTAVQSAQNIFVIHGKPAVYARTMAAQVRRAGYKIHEVEASDTKVVWQGLRDGNWASSEWTMERADKAQYTSNERYQTNPQEMLRAKAIAEVCRIQYQDVLLGMAYTVEELMLEQVTVTRPVKQGVRGTAKLREIAEAAAQTPDGSPAEEQPPAPVAGEPPTTVAANDEQLDRIRALGKAKGLTASGLLEEITLFLQRDKRLPSLHKLTADEADAVITGLVEPESGTTDG
jgi:hypothetical protein